MATNWAWDAVGVPAIVVAGTLLHFAFERSGRNPIVGLVAPVNESVWEHLKMAYWPAVAYALVQWAVVDDAPANFFTAKAVAVWTMGAVMLGLYFATVAAPWEPTMTARLVADGLTFVVAVAAGQLASHVVLASQGWAGTAAGVAAFAGPAIVLGVTTFWPPRWELFRDQQDQTFGIGHRR